ncbi:hypothetical protein ABT010_35395 [Streptomyces sp. NPDC002668]|uniref:hypothetical protein n=1 Tax=Streptomyces sp. NPDC002668 TaxID=3154422 RepID=UPI00332BEC6E
MSRRHTPGSPTAQGRGGRAVRARSAAQAEVAVPPAPGAEQYPALDFANTAVALPGGQLLDLLGTPAATNKGRPHEVERRIDVQVLCDVEHQVGGRPNNPAGVDAYWPIEMDGRYGGRWGTIQTTWSGTGKETIDLGWSITATVNAGGNPATANFGTSGDVRVRELAPRCDDILKGVAPGCVLPFFKPTYTVDTNLYPAAGAYYWLMQEKMPDHAGSVKWDSLLHYFPSSLQRACISAGTSTAIACSS